MPTVLELFGWRLFFYANEGNEPMHIHCRKGDAEAKFWLDAQQFDIREEYAFNLSPNDRKVIRKIIFNHFEQLAAAWEDFQRQRQS